MHQSVSKTPRHKTKQDFSPSPRKSILREHKIHNQQKLKVFIKFKPSQNHSQSQEKSALISYLNEKELEIQNSVNKKIYTFDHVFDHMVEPQTVYNLGCCQLIEQVIEGVHADKSNNNGLMFVYGNTGTGKTHTMGLIDEINIMSQGLVPDALRHIFEDNNTIEEVCISFCQIYKDQVYDLLDFQEQKKLSIRQNQKSKQPFIEDLIIIQVKTFKQASQLINIGLEKRRIAEQKINNRSSRGHGIITFYLKNQNSSHTGRISFVDLAGCERIKQSESKGSTLNEALYINTSLSALQTLLMNISDQNVRSYRSNKLTRLLQPYFEFGKIRLFVTSNYESIQSIEFAKRCKGIKFHQKQVKKQTYRLSKTPKKAQKPDEKISSHIDYLKRQFKIRQNSFMKCISNLVSVIQKIYQSINSFLAKQSIHSSFSLPQLFQHLPLQSKVNAKINIFQKKQEEIIHDQKEDSFQKLSSQISTNISRANQDFNAILQKTQQIMKNSQQVGFSAIKKITQLSQLTDYKNIYKKEWFTSQIKNGLLESKNDQFERAIVYLMEQFNKFTRQNAGNAKILTKISRKLKQYGVIIADESSLTSKSASKSIQQNKFGLTKARTPIKLIACNKPQQNLSSLSNENSQILLNKSQKRSIIFIDQD